MRKEDMSGGRVTLVRPGTSEFIRIGQHYLDTYRDQIHPLVYDKLNTVFRELRRRDDGLRYMEARREADRVGALPYADASGAPIQYSREELREGVKPFYGIGNTDEYIDAKVWSILYGLGHLNLADDLEGKFGDQPKE